MFNPNSKYQIKTPKGWSNFSGIKISSKTEMVTIKLENGRELKCSMDHPLKLSINSQFELAKNFTVGELIETEEGPSKIISISFSPSSELFYDLIDVEKDNQYYTNGIVSHNCEFLGSSSTLIDGFTLRNLMNGWIPPAISADKDSFLQGLDIYQQPKPGVPYVITVDTAQGQDLDYSAFSVFDVSAEPYRQVAKYRSNTIAPLLYPNVILAAANMFNEAYVFIELNDQGAQVANILHLDLEYENICTTKNDPKKGNKAGQKLSFGSSGKKSNLGVIMSKSVKNIGCLNLKTFIESGKLITVDFETISELSTFVPHRTSFAADKNKNDDLVMTLVLFAWLASQPSFKELTDTDLRKRLADQRIAEEESFSLPSIFVSNGIDDTSSNPWNLSEDDDFPGGWNH